MAAQAASVSAAAVTARRAARARWCALSMRSGSVENAHRADPKSLRRLTHVVGDQRAQAQVFEPAPLSQHDNKLEHERNIAVGARGTDDPTLAAGREFHDPALVEPLLGHRGIERLFVSVVSHGFNARQQQRPAQPR